MRPIRTLPIRILPIRILLASVVTVGLALGSVTIGSAHDSHRQEQRDLARARRATTRYHDVDRAIADGYGVLADRDGVRCIDGPPGEGNMGIHYVNEALVGDGKVDLVRPEAVLYERKGGRLRLTALEYVVFASDWSGARPPQLFGHDFMLVDEPNRYGLPPFYELHVWLYKSNPNGRFDDWNPRVSCRGPGTVHVYRW